jgi:hypothetical protein
VIITSPRDEHGKEGSHKDLVELQAKESRCRKTLFVIRVKPHGAITYAYRMSLHICQQFVNGAYALSLHRFCPLGHVSATYMKPAYFVDRLLTNVATDYFFFIFLPRVKSVKLGNAA